MLKPWRRLGDIKGTSGSFEQEFASFIADANEYTKDIIDNIQYFHECSDGARKRRTEGTSTVDRVPLVEIPNGDEGDDMDNRGQTLQVTTEEYTEEDVEAAHGSGQAMRDVLHGQVALRIAEDCGFFCEDNSETCWKKSAPQATTEDLVQFQEWQDIIAKIRKHSPEGLAGVIDRTEGFNLNLSPAVRLDQHGEEPSVSVMDAPETIQSPSTTLNDDQERAFNIIGNHLKANLAGKKPDQLLMILIGHGGVGKSTLINAVTDLFDRLKARELLAKTGTTGIAASHIGGTMLHRAAYLYANVGTMVRKSGESNKRSPNS